MRRSTRSGTAWPVILVFILVLLPPGLTFDIAQRYRVLPNDLAAPFAVLEAIIITTYLVAVARGNDKLQRITLTAFCASGVASALGGLGFLIGMLVDARALEAQRLLASAMYTWSSNTLFFALIYWGIDGGGPAGRAVNARPRDFVFPEMQLTPDAVFLPTFMDYVYLAFSTSTAFSATDTLTASSRVRVLLIAQAAIALGTVAIVAARAVNIFPSG
ncbi:MAG TPA: hypothetical protein VFN49_12815 [Candidatus Aquilonibacter sp.]|nr:hypothetical protein [Candidatus Aquilonibacter sp.]